MSHMDTDKMSLTKKEQMGLTMKTFWKLKREQIADINPEALFADGFDEAIVGYESNGACAVYNYDKCLDVLTKRDGMDSHEAHEYMEFNVVSAYVGDFTPVFIHTI